MTDVATSNGTKTNGSEMSEEQYRALCRQLRQEQLKRGKGKKVAKPVLLPLGDITTVNKPIKLEKSATEWSKLPTGCLFSLDTEGTILFCKTGKERAVNLVTQASVPVGSASAYRCHL